MAAEFSNAEEKLMVEMRPRPPRGLKPCGHLRGSDVRRLTIG